MYNGEGTIICQVQGQASTPVTQNAAASMPMNAPDFAAPFYRVAHKSAGRLRLRPLRPEDAAALPDNQIIAANALARYCDNLPATAQVSVAPVTGSVLIIVLRANTSPARKNDGEPRNPVPGRLVSYLIPKLFNTAVAIWRALPYIGRGLVALARERALTLETLDASALLVCILRRDYKTLASIIFFFALAEYLADWTRKKSEADLAEKLALNIDSVWIEAAGEEIQIPFRRLKKDDTVIVRGGCAIPADGRVVAGEGMVNQSSLTGEDMPQRRQVGSSVYAGTILEEGELRVQVEKAGGDSRIRSILRYIEESEEAKAGIAGRYERIADSVVPWNFLLAGLVLLITRSPYRAGSVLLVDYSCAIRLATPLCILTGMREAADCGALVKGGKAIEALAEADTVVFDKTGTLTEARPEVVEVIPFGPLTKPGGREQVLKIAACLEEHFPHPVGQAVVEAAKKEGINHREEHTEVEFIVAHGIASRLNGQRVLLGSEHFVLEDHHTRLSKRQHETVEQRAALGLSLLYLALDGELAGLICIADRLRDETPAVIQALRDDGARRIIMLTGDGLRTAKRIAAMAGIDEYRANMLPEEKAAFVALLRQQGGKVLMIGDGVNDSPALAAADIGCAMQGGADMAREVADMVLVSGRLEDMLTARAIARETLARVRVGFGFSLVWNTMLLTASLGGVISPGVSAFLHNAGTSALAVRLMRPMSDDIVPQTPLCLEARP
jgi:Cu2+-exporting ATPase